MKATSIKQIKFNRGQVSGMLSERVDMGLQNACGTVYDNTYINRYGQLETAPVLKLASNGRNVTDQKTFMMFDTGTDLVLPVGVDYGSTDVNYYAWRFTPEIVATVKVRQGTSLFPASKTKNCPRAPEADFVEDGVNYYGWLFNHKYAFRLQSSSPFTQWIYYTLDYVFTTSPNPSAGDTLTIKKTPSTGSGLSIESKTLDSVVERKIVYTKSAAPSAADEVFDTDLNYVGSLYQYANQTIIYDGNTYERYSDGDTQRGASMRLCVYSPLSKNDNTITTDLTAPVAYVSLTADLPTKAYQFGYNVIMYDQNTKPFLFNIVEGTNGWYSPKLTVRENHFNNSFDNIYIRGTDVNAPDDFTPPTTGSYRINNQTTITSSALVTIDRNGAGSNFTQSLVGQVILCHANSGAVQVRSVEGNDSLTAYVLSPLVNNNSGSTYIDIPFSNNQSEWIFGYEKVYGTTEGYPDSVIYANQRLIFGGNDKHGSIISASRIGVINDFDPESATESDAFTTSISSRNYCRVVDFVVSNNELRIACTNGEYAMSLANLTPSGSLNGFDLRSEVGIAKNTPICDCGGLTAYVSNDRKSINGTQFSLLRDRFQPVSLTSQTEGIVDNCIKLTYLVNRQNQEGNLLVGLNNNGNLFAVSVDTNSGLVGAFKIKNIGFNVVDNISLKIVNIMGVEYALWGIINVTDFNAPANFKTYIVRFARNEFFNFPCGLTLPTDLAQFIGQTGIHFKGLLVSGDGYELADVVSTTDNQDGTTTVSFGEEEDERLFVAGFLRQCDWRSVEIGIGMATREINKNIIKLSSVVKPQEFWDWAHTETTTIPLNNFKGFFNLVRGQETQTIAQQFDPSIPIDLYAEGDSMVWRRAFDNPDREVIFGFTSIAPFIIKSITATLQYDEVE